MGPSQLLAAAHRAAVGAEADGIDGRTEVTSAELTAKSEKNWVEDPQGVQWETFLTTGESTVYGSDAVEGARSKPCCEPTKAA
jgi:hypothetical protein